MFVVTVLLSVEPDRIDAFRTAMAVQARTSLEEEPGCRQFDVAYDPDDPTVCFLYELYSDRAAFEAHLASDHFRAFDARVAPWLRAKTVETYRRAWPKS